MQLFKLSSLVAVIAAVLLVEAVRPDADDTGTATVNTSSVVNHEQDQLESASESDRETKGRRRRSEVQKQGCCCCLIEGGSCYWDDNKKDCPGDYREWKCKDSSYCW